MSNNLHKVWMYRVLTSIVDTPESAKVLRFKGGTCAAMRGLLNRFSVDLDFDIVAEKKSCQNFVKFINLFSKN